MSIAAVRQEEAIVRDQPRRNRASRVFWMSILISVVALPFVLRADADLYLTSDDGLYNTIALDAAQNVPLLAQLNPLETEYIRYPAQRFGAVTVKDFGYYKILGIYYTLVSAVGEPGPGYAIALNVLLLAIGARLAYRLACRITSEHTAYVSTLAFVLHPLVIELQTFVRKDITVVVLLVLLLYQISTHKSWWALLASSAILGYCRAPLLLLLAPLFVIEFAGRLIGVRRAMVVAFVVPLAVVASAGLDSFFDTFNASPTARVAATYGADISGLGGKLLSSPLGQPIYVLLYPFPSLNVSGWLESVFRLYANCGYVATIVLLPFFWKGCRAAVREGWWQSHILFTYALLFAQLCAMAFIGSRAEMYGIVEPRYKMMLLLPYFVLVGLGWERRRHEQRIDLRTVTLSQPIG